MARKRSPNRKLAFQIWQKSKGKTPLTDIAEELGVTSSTIRKWKSLDHWSLNSKGSAPIEKERYSSMKGNANASGNHGGAPPDNRNSVGNSGGGAPLANKNALVTGKYETISFDYLSEKERELFEGVTDDPLITLNTQIREMKIRQYRILGRMNNCNPSDLSKLEDALTSVSGSLLRATQQKQHIVEVEGPDTDDDDDEPDGFLKAVSAGVQKNGLPIDNGVDEGANDDE